MALPCCVCEKEVPPGSEHWPNAWEKTRQRFACCSTKCINAFNPDLHWLPSKFPTTALENESDRLVGVLRTRLKDGDSPSVVTREMLLAGVEPNLIRGILLRSQSDGAKNRAAARETTVVGLVTGFLFGMWRFGINRDKRKPEMFEPAFADLDRWERAMTLR
jgi:hypothetical protein